jgi:hypothetical protein
LPNIDLPVVAEGDFYPVYFSRGVLLEADLVRLRVEEQVKASAVRRVIQVFRSSDIGEAAAAQLESGLVGPGLVVENRKLQTSPDSATELADAVRDAGRGDVLVLWLRPSDVALLPAVAPAASVLLLSGLMAGLERAPLPGDWRSASTQMTYPVDLPELRKVRMNFPLMWMKIRQIDVVAERVQTDTYIACGILAETLTDMLDSFVPDYLVERIEGMLSHRLVNGYYPRLSLGPGQRFASKGGYMVRFGAASNGSDPAVEGDWLIP